MRRILPRIFWPCFALTFSIGAVCAGVCAQETAATRTTPPAYRGVASAMEGVFVTPVPNEPLTAVVELQSTQVLQDGTTESKKSVNDIARDSQGRIYNERRAMVPEDYSGKPPLMLFHIFDPTTTLNTFLDPSTHVARQSVHAERVPADGSARAGISAVSRPGIQEEDLGEQSMQGVVVRGLRRTRTLAAAYSGTGKQVIIVDEIWYSDELHLNMLVKHDDPRSGQQTVTITNVNRSEPAASMFEIPGDYKVVDETPPRQ